MTGVPMLRFTIAFSVATFAAPAFAAPDKDEVCGLQGEMTSQIQQARLDGVAMADVEKTILSGNPSWPENYNKAIPTLAQWVFQTDISVLEQTDMGAIWQSECLKNWDFIKQSIGN